MITASTIVSFSIRPMSTSLNGCPTGIAENAPVGLVRFGVSATTGNAVGVARVAKSAGSSVGSDAGEVESGVPGSQAPGGIKMTWSGKSGASTPSAHPLYSAKASIVTQWRSAISDRKSPATIVYSSTVASVVSVVSGVVLLARPSGPRSRSTMRPPTPIATTLAAAMTDVRQTRGTPERGDVAARSNGVSLRSGAESKMSCKADRTARSRRSVVARPFEG